MSAPKTAAVVGSALPPAAGRDAPLHGELEVAIVEVGGLPGADARQTALVSCCWPGIAGARAAAVRRAVGDAVPPAITDAALTAYFTDADAGGLDAPTSAVLQRASAVFPLVESPATVARYLREAVRTRSM